MASQNPWKIVLLTLTFATTKVMKYQPSKIDTPRNKISPTKKALLDKLSRLRLNNPIQIIEPNGYT